MLLAISSVSSGAAFWLFKPPTANEIPEGLESNWQLPELSISSKKIQELYSKLRKLQPWGADATTSSTATLTGAELDAAEKELKAAQIKLKLVGLVRKRQGSYALFLNKDMKKTNAYFLNQTLPNGLQLVSIHADSVTVKQADQEIQVIFLYETQ